jgi:serine/threonine protein kinase
MILARVIISEVATTRAISKGPTVMSISVEQATDSILRTGLLDDSELSTACEEIAEQGHSFDGENLLEHLTRTGQLTAFQARKVAAGNSAELVLGNYVILNQIGQGGMGVVYKAMHRRMKRLVAIKIIKKGLAEREFIERFRREIEAAARLVHPHVVAAYDADECELGDFLVMEYVEGTDLRDIVRRTGPLHVDEALSILKQSAQALQYAHDQGIIHRDIKPANLMRDITNVTKIADLGLARVLNSNETREGLTEVGMVAGTLDYMPPEQAVDSSTVDHRADIYSLGCTFFYLLTGGPPFTGRSVLEKMLAHKETPPPNLFDLVDDVSQDVDDIFQKMMVKDPDDRYQSMNELIQDISDLDADATDLRSLAASGADTTVLIVEKSRLQAAMITKMLNEMDIDDVHVTSCGKDAIEKLEKIPVHVVLTSAQLPDMLGVSLAEHIRDELRWSQVAVVVMASDPLNRSMSKMLDRIGACAVIQKPFDSAQLNTTIDQVLAAENSDTGELSLLRTRQVLIVDDSRVAQRRIQQTLTELGFSEFVTADDGMQGVSCMKEETFDLVVTDYNMPNMDGHEFVSWVRNESEHRDVPIIMVTTEFDPTKLADVYQLGVSAICNKSFDRDQVRNIVIRLFL